MWSLWDRKARGLGHEGVIKAPDVASVALGTRKEEGEGHGLCGRDMSWVFRVVTCLGPHVESLG
jgi:hypothetical protein